LLGGVSARLPDNLVDLDQALGRVVREEGVGRIRCAQPRGVARRIEAVLLERALELAHRRGRRDPAGEDRLDEPVQLLGRR
jgi:hypothetical protein